MLQSLRKRTFLCQKLLGPIAAQNVILTVAAVAYSLKESTHTFMTQTSSELFALYFQLNYDYIVHLVSETFCPLARTGHEIISV